ncbi:MAG: GtrA family protein [bacterium]|nr:GtrA family protein [bacterium]MCP4966905.1 GtrA family protein [bacterium]
MRIALGYALFAVIATIANIGSQDISLMVYGGSISLITSLTLGTAIGLVVKYSLDKRYIFCYQINNVRHEGRTFYLYAVMGLATTAIFWLFELGFDYVFDSKQMRYVGGMVGLAIGYYTKYQLDRRYVFT